MKKITYILLLFVMVFGMGKTVLAASGAIDLLKESTGARAIGLGGAFTAVGNSIYSTGWNPAGLGEITRSSVFSNYSSLLTDVSRLGLSGTIPAFDGCFGLNLLIESVSGAPLTTVGPDGRPNLEGYFSDLKKLFSVSYARQALLNNLLAGATIKYHNNGLSSASASGFSFDLGALYYPLNSEKDKGPLSLGLTIRNPFSTGLKWSSGNVDHFTREFVFGAAYKGELMNREYLVSGDFNYGAGKKFCFGVEYWITNAFPIRLGFNKEHNITFGTGLKLNNLEFDVSYFSNSDLGPTYNFTFGWNFN